MSMEIRYFPAIWETPDKNGERHVWSNWKRKYPDLDTLVIHSMNSGV